MTPKQDSIEMALKNEGFAKLPIVDKSITGKLMDLYVLHVIREIKQGETYWSMSDRNKTLSSFLNRSIIELTLPFLQLHFEDIKPIVSTFMIKPAYAPSVMPHQDWTFVDGEPEMSSFTCWLPLVDINEQNGMMGFLPGSHNLYTGYRASPSPPFGHIFPQTEAVLNQIKYIEQKAGEAVVFNHRVIHASLPNKSNMDRPAIGITFTSTKSRLVHMFLKPGIVPATLTKYAVDEAFYNKYSNTELKDLFEKGSSIPDYNAIEDVVLTSGIHEN